MASLGDGDHRPPRLAPKKRARTLGHKESHAQDRSLLLSDGRDVRSGDVCGAPSRSEVPPLRELETRGVRQMPERLHDLGDLCDYERTRSAPIVFASDEVVSTDRGALRTGGAGIMVTTRGAPRPGFAPRPRPTITV